MADQIDISKPRRRRGSTGLILGVIVVLASLWVGYWYAARQIVEAAMERATSAPLAGRKIGCTGESLGGFPLRLDVRCQRATYANALESVTVALGGLSASAPLYRPGYVTATLDSPLVVNLPRLGIAMTATWSLATAELSVWIGGLTGGGASFVTLNVENNGDLIGPPAESLTADAAEVAVMAVGGGDYRLTSVVRGVNLTFANGAALPEIDGEASIIAQDVGASLGTDPTAKFLDWLRAGGTASIERIKVAAAGAILIANGTLTLSENGLLSGSILLRFNSIAALADLLEELRPGSRDSIALPLQGLNAFSVPVETAEGLFRQTTLTFTDGVIWLGFIPLPDPIPPIRF